MIGAASREAPRAASAAATDLLQTLLGDSGRDLSDATGFVADVGPGSFTGVRVGVMMAKALGFAAGVPVAGVSSAALISTTETVVFPSRRGEWFIFAPGEVPRRDIELPPAPFCGFGPGVEPPRFPEAARAAKLVAELEWVDAQALMPDYHMAPSISTPKTRMDGLA